MTKQTNGSNRNGQKGDPNQDVQPWLGWIAAMFVVVIVVVAVALGVERTNNQSQNAAEVRMTPLVGGMEVPVATETGAVGAASEVTLVAQAISETATISMVTVITATRVPSDTFLVTGAMTPTDALTATEGVTTSTEITTTLDVTVVPTATTTTQTTVAPTAAPTVTPTVLATNTVEPAVEPTAEATLVPTSEATASPTPRPTVQPNATAPASVGEHEVGDMVVASGGRVEVYADVSEDALILDSLGPGVTLEVLDPSGDYSEYPVEVDGVEWVRVRAPDGLVGWVMSDQVEAQ